MPKKPVNEFGNQLPVSQYASKKAAQDDLIRKGYTRVDEKSTQLSEMWAHPDQRHAMLVGTRVTHYEAGQLPG